MNKEQGTKLFEAIMSGASFIFGALVLIGSLRLPIHDDLDAVGYYFGLLIGSMAIVMSLFYLYKYKKS